MVFIAKKNYRVSYNRDQDREGKGWQLLLMSSKEHEIAGTATVDKHILTGQS